MLCDVRDVEHGVGPDAQTHRRSNAQAKKLAAHRNPMRIATPKLSFSLAFVAIVPQWS
jgi:hypothetical protein